MPRPIRCILLIDDDPDDNYIHQLIIDETELCETVRVAENGQLGLAYLTKTDHPDYVRPDIILLDINMPGMNGFEFLEHYRQIDPSLQSRVVLLMLTTSLFPADTTRARQFSEVKGYLSKPLSQDMLQTIVNQHFS
ncbi:response regulator [Fibrisoma limi BUZ 3]|uniref:Response regulator n=1 Tax=Fibrisoma limi BUZ 3 TaxID=1185876 RepID=I2GLM4_9BACT|nr:response regulator [Fibrisoma limi]CCH54800.1 response regulator [Fibrisoma limi BUZ 3]